MHVQRHFRSHCRCRGNLLKVPITKARTYKNFNRDAFVKDITEAPLSGVTKTKNQRRRPKT